ncbi:MAG: cytidylate kinase [Hyphomicrobiaceae bacterium]|nr:cytidylate kinase [Hyphomicrobiaceae bacterium]
MIIAIDGPAASGKGTLANRIAEHYGLDVLDTGLLYRAVARDLAARGWRLDDPWAGAAMARALDHGSLDDPLLRGPKAGTAASIAARNGEVRRALFKFQRAFANRNGGAVLDGRDIGTVICPDADVKIFVTASPDIRAARRHAEMSLRGETSTLAEVLADIKERDARDAGRGAAPLTMAADAVLLDTSELDIDAVLQAAVRLIERKISQSGRVNDAS